jgi:hypothetical protein
VPMTTTLAAARRSSTWASGRGAVLAFTTVAVASGGREAVDLFARWQVADEWGERARPEGR